VPFVELVVGPADFVNAGAMLRGIKKRIESAVARQPVPVETRDPGYPTDAVEPRLAEPERAVATRRQPAETEEVAR
jgi:hypothetical protein